MKSKLIYLLGIAVIIFFISANNNLATASGGVGIGTFSKVKKAGDETITINYKDYEGEVKTITTATGEFGSNHTGDDLPKGMSGEDKAARIASAINAEAQAGGHPIAVNVMGHVITVGTTGNAKGLTKFDVSNNTRQKHNKTWVSHSINEVHQEAYVYLTGGVAGHEWDSDETQSEIRVGTARHLVVKMPSHNTPLATLASEIVEELIHHGVSASLVRPTIIRIVLDEEMDCRLHYGCTDAGVNMTAEVELVWN